VACRSAREKRDLLRVVRTPAGEITLDPTGRVSGRGAYVDRDPACIDLALDRGLLGKALDAKIPAGFRSELLAAADTTLTGGARGQE
jgi:predicted RNA-binding protein YlxR (DUF448 family)